MQDNNGSYTYNLIEYTADDMEQWLDDVYVNESTLNAATASVTDLEKVTPPMCTTMEFTCPSGNHGSGSYNVCVYDDMTTWSYHIVPTSCDDGGGGSGGEDPITGPSNPSGGGGGSNPVIITTPTKTLQPWEEVLDCMPSVLQIPGAIVWLQNNKNGAGQILNYLKENDCSAESQNEAVGIIVSNLIIDNTDIISLNPCSKNIYIELEDLQQGGIKRVLNTFCSPNSVYDWQLKSQAPNNPVFNASTDWERDPSNVAIANSYITKIKPTFESTATKIAIARTILHEAIHTYLLSQVDAANAGTINQAQFQDNFPLLWEYYMDDLGAANVAQHETIAQLFVNTIANALAEWDNNTQSPQYYKDLAWGGLDGTAIFQNTTSLTGFDRLRIIGVNLAEDKNLPQTYINESGQLTIVLPKGTSCP